MSTFNELIAEITGIVPGYSAFLAQRDLKKAYRDIIQRRSWSFLFAEGSFASPSLISAGSVSVTQNLTTIVADVTAAAALNAVVIGPPPLTQRQFRISSAGAIYNITAWNNTTRTLTVDRPILEDTASAASYQVYQCYFYPPPQALVAGGLYDFNRWVSVIDPVTPIVLNVQTDKAWLDWRDPQRSTSPNLSYDIYNYKSDSLGNTLYEFWPAPNGQEFTCLYVKRGLDFTNGGAQLPQQIPEALLIDRCLYRYVYRWAALNAGRNPALAKTNYAFLMREGSAQWEVDLQHAKMTDENLYLQAIVGPLRDRGWRFPVDAAFMQSHSLGLEPYR